jgi:predicted short-subunit dehydrogenase-like oxidoreductase (DUF2520 family)
VNYTVQSISIVGSGNVAHHLGTALLQIGVSISYVIGRNSIRASELASKFGAKSSSQLSDIPKEDLIILCVPDSSISELLKSINSDIGVVYTSGSVKLDELPRRRMLGVFYPLQTFSKETELEYVDIPFFIEADEKEFEQSLIELARRISDNVQRANSDYRANLHHAAVWVNNFTNHIIHNAQVICKENDVDFDHLRPLLHETINKLTNDSAFNSQTGPARRGDKETINKHISGLSGIQKELYEKLTKSIIKTYNDDQL